MSIYETLARAGNFRAFLASIKIAGLGCLLETEEESTLFAPTDAAFAKLSAEELDHFLARPERMANLLAFHFLPYCLTLEDIREIRPRGQIGGKRFKVEENQVTINNVKITNPNQKCSHAVVHAIDSVLLPDKMQLI